MKKNKLALLLFTMLCSGVRAELIELNSSADFEKLLQENSIVVVDFYAPWCGPCKTQGPVLHNMAEKHPEVTFIKVNIDQHDSISTKYRVASIPTIIYFKNGRESHRTVGLQREKQLTLAVNNLR